MMCIYITQSLSMPGYVKPIGACIYKLCTKNVQNWQKEEQKYDNRNKTWETEVMLSRNFIKMCALYEKRWNKQKNYYASKIEIVYGNKKENQWETIH